MNIVTNLDIKNHGMCKWDDKIQCSVYCAGFMKNQCGGMRFIRTDVNKWIDQTEYPFPKYKEEHKKDDVNA